MRAGAHPGPGIVVDSRGNVYFVVFGASHLMKLDPRGRASVFVSDDRVRLPHHLVIGRDRSSLYVTSDDDGRVWRVDSAGRLTLHLDSRRLARAASRFQVGAGGDPFAVDSAGGVYALAEPSASAIVRADSTGPPVPLAPRARLGPMHFRAMTVAGDGALYVSDAGGIWRIRGDSAQLIRPRGAAFEQPVGVARDDAGNILVADYRARRVHRLASDGSINTPTWLADARFHGPTGVAVAGDTVYVLDNGFRSAAVWRLTDAGVERIYTQSMVGWHAPRLFWLVPVLLVALALLNRWMRR